MSDPLDQLDEDLSAVSFVEGTEAASELEELLGRARRLFEVKLCFEARRPADAPPLVVIAGGTNVGKSTVFNWVVGETVASSSPLARHTKAPTVYVHDAELAGLQNGVFLPSYRRLALEKPQDAAGESPEGVAFFLKTHEHPDVRGVVLIDSPDIDSTHARNRQVAEDLLFLADALIFVSTPEKYNDELCVRYLRQAGELHKLLVCVLNKGGDDEVVQDFCEVVVPGLEARAHVLTVPYVTPKPEPAAEASYREELRAAVLGARTSAVDVRAEARRGACIRLGQDLDRVTSRLREELTELDRIRSEVALVLQARREEYRRFLMGLEFYELDRVFERVLAYFRIPVLDAVYDGFRGAISFVGSNVSRLVTGRPERDSRQAKLQARAETDRQKLKELIEAARAEVLEVPYLHAGALRTAVPSWVEALEGSTVEDVNRDIDTFSQRAEAHGERWIENETQRVVEVLEQHPYARNALRAMKGVLQVGFGLVSAKLTGGFGPWDLLIGGATERGVKLILESTGGYVHYQTLKSEFAVQRAELFHELLRETVQEQLLSRLPAGVDPDRLERLSQAATALKRGGLP